MSKFCGKIGFFTDVEIEPGVWAQQLVERQYFGELTALRNRLTTGSGVNDDISISNEISIIADPFAQENFSHIKYVEFMNANWKVTSVEVQYPRLKLTVGGLYNE